MGKRKRPSKSDGKIIGWITKQEFDGKIIDGITEQESTDPSKTAKLETKKEDLIVSDGGETKLCFFDSKLEESQKLEADTSPTEGSSLPNAQLFPTQREKRRSRSCSSGKARRSFSDFDYDSDDKWDEVKLHRFKVRTFQLGGGGGDNGGGGISDSGGSRGQGF